VKGKRVLVCGATGLIGYALCKRLVSEGAKVRGTTHKRQFPKVDGVEYVHADLTQLPHAHWAMEGMEIVFQCAASVIGAAATAKDPMQNVHQNTSIYVNTFQAARDCGVSKFIHLSSGTGYPDSPKPMKEGDYFSGPLFSKYFHVGTIKRFAERLGMMYARDGLQVISVRPTNVYGPNDNFNVASSHFLPALMVKAVEKRGPIEIWGTGQEVRDVVYADDMADGLVRCAKYDEPGFHAFNFAGGNPMDVNAYLREVLVVTGRIDAQIRYIETNNQMISVRLQDTTKAKEVLGWAPKTSLRDGIAKSIDWYRENPLTDPASWGTAR
jgi:GDP-L-fucose synthase